MTPTPASKFLSKSRPRVKYPELQVVLKLTGFQMLDLKSKPVKISAPFLKIDTCECLIDINVEIPVIVSRISETGCRVLLWQLLNLNKESVILQVLV